MTVEEEIRAEVEAEEHHLPKDAVLTKAEALAYIVWKMHRKGLVHVPKSQVELEEEAKEDEVLKQFGL